MKENKASQLFNEVVAATGKNFTIKLSMNGYYRLMLGEDPVIDDSACEDVNEGYDVAEGYFIRYLLENEVPEGRKEMRCGIWILK